MPGVVLWRLVVFSSFAEPQRAPPELEPSESASVGADTEGAPSPCVRGWRRQRLADGDRFGRARLSVLLCFSLKGNGLAWLRARGVTNGDQC